jgi:hypothetical protein
MAVSTGSFGPPTAGHPMPARLDHPARVDSPAVRESVVAETGEALGDEVGLGRLQLGGRHSRPGPAGRVGASRPTRPLSAAAVAHLSSGRPANAPSTLFPSGPVTATAASPGEANGARISSSAHGRVARRAAGDEPGPAGQTAREARSGVVEAGMPPPSAPDVDSNVDSNVDNEENLETQRVSLH